VKNESLVRRVGRDSVSHFYHKNPDDLWRFSFIFRCLERFTLTILIEAFVNIQLRSTIVPSLIKSIHLLIWMCNLSAEVRTSVRHRNVEHNLYNTAGYHSIRSTTCQGVRDVHRTQKHVTYIKNCTKVQSGLAKFVFQAKSTRNCITIVGKMPSRAKALGTVNFRQSHTKYKHFRREIAMQQRRKI
jgi:hypothetical protein